MAQERIPELPVSRHYSVANGKLVAGFVSGMTPDQHLSAREIAKELSLSVSTVGPALRDLTIRGHVKRRSGISKFNNPRGLREQIYYVERIKVERHLGERPEPIVLDKEKIAEGVKEHFAASQPDAPIVGPGPGDNYFEVILNPAAITPRDTAFEDFVLSKSQEIEKVLGVAQRQVDNLLSDLLVEAESRARQAVRGIDSFSDDELAAELLRRLK